MGFDNTFSTLLYFFKLDYINVVVNLELKLKHPVNIFIKTVLLFLSINTCHLFSQPDWRFENNLDGSQNGWSVSTAGDVNNDGYDDVVSGSWLARGRGEVYLHMGSDTGLAADPEITLIGLNSNADMGTSLSSGDFNNDGFGDVVVGANGDVGGGSAFVYYGSQSGITTTADWTNGGESSGAQYGWSVSGAGDVNGDKFDDLIVSAIRQSGRGRVYLYLGSDSGLSLTPDWTADGSSGASFGRSISTAGDVNNDGFDDILVGANGSGEAYVFFGSDTGLSAVANWTGSAESGGSYYGWYVSEAGDVNADNFSDIIVGAYSQGGQGATYLYLGSSNGPSQNHDWKTSGGQSGSLYGVSVSSAGDVDSDGYDDIMISAEGYDGGHNNEGRIFIFLGSQSGLANTADSFFEINSTNAYLGANVSQAGDVNGDHLGDMIIGAYRYSNGESEEGESVVYHGWTTPGTKLNIPNLQSQWVKKIHYQNNELVVYLSDFRSIDFYKIRNINSVTIKSGYIYKNNNDKLKIEGLKLSPGRYVLELNRSYSTEFNIIPFSYFH